MQKSSVLVTSEEAPKGVKFSKAPALRRFSVLWTPHFEYFNAFRPPLAGGILMGGNPDFLPFDEAVRIAVMALAGCRYFFAIDDFCVRHFHPPQHLVSAFDEDPAFYRRLVCRRIGDLATERSIHGESRWDPDQQQRKRETHKPAGAAS